MFEGKITPDSIDDRLRDGKKFKGWEHFAMPGDPNYEEATLLTKNPNLNQVLPTLKDCILKIVEKSG